MKVYSRNRLKDLPGVGAAIAEDLRRLGVCLPDDLMTHDSEDLFGRLVELDGPTDRCVLDRFRGAHYYVATNDDEIGPELLHWWRWKHL